MSATFKARVWELITVTGTGSITLGGVVQSGGYQSFGTAFPANATVTYCINDPIAGTWETGIGTYTTSTKVLTRGVLESSNANALVSFAGNTCNVTVDIVSPTTVSSGGASSGLIPALGASGTLDQSFNSFFAENTLTTTGLTWGYLGGIVNNNGTPVTVAAGTIALTASATNYVSVTPAGTVVKSTTGWTAGAFPIRTLVTGASAITTDTDSRGFFFITTTGKDYDIAGGIPGVPTASQVVARYTLARAITFPANFSGSYWVAGTAATASTTFTVAVNGTSIGTIVFAASGTVATFTTTGGAIQNVAAGAVLTITAPATPDTTLANASGTLAGTLQ